jgi:hypothetical protein
MMFKTKQRATFAAGLFGVFVLSGAAPAEPYAPMAKDPGKPTIAGQEAGYPLEQMMLQATATIVPDRSAVEQPPYPGAVIVTAQKGGPGSANDVPFVALPSLVLHTTDDVATVLAFYVEALPGWTKYDYFGMDYLYEGSGEFKPFEKSGMETPNIFVMELPDAMKFHAMPDAVTSITIAYK